MKCVQTEITPSINSYLSIIEKDSPYFIAPLHSHPEVELVYIKEGFGKRIIGDKIEPFEAGDMVFIGSNLPHTWRSDEQFYKEDSRIRSKATVVYFNKCVFSSVFYHMQETLKIKGFFQKAERGILIKGNTKTKVLQKLNKLQTKEGFEKILGLFEILNLLSQSKEISIIVTDGYNAEEQHPEKDRLSEVYKYVQENYREDISLDRIAGIANLTPQSFCRLFKKRTNKHFIEYLNAVRISYACKNLLETDCSIFEVAYDCGYKTVSNFNKLFKKITCVNPTEYRAKAKQL